MSKLPQFPLALYIYTIDSVCYHWLNKNFQKLSHYFQISLKCPTWGWQVCRLCGCHIATICCPPQASVGDCFLIGSTKPGLSLWLWINLCCWVARYALVLFHMKCQVWRTALQLLQSVRSSHVAPMTRQWDSVRPTATLHSVLWLSQGSCTASHGCSMMLQDRCRLMLC